MVKSKSRMTNTTTLTPEEESSQASIASFRFSGQDQSAIVNALIQRGVIVSQRFNGVRFSFHVYNREEDVTKAVGVLEELLAR